MKLSQVSHHGNVELALWRGRDLFSLRNIAPRLSLSDLLGASGSLRNDLEQRLNRAHSQDILDPEQLIFLPPLPETSKILCAGLNYQSHATEVAAPVAEFPNFFTRFTDTLVGHGQALRIPANSQELDYEGELAVVIGKTCYGPLTENQALDAVSGYTIFNDASVRDFQFRASQWTLGKNFLATGGCGPVLVSADELPPGAKGLNLHTLIDGTVMQTGNTADLIFNVAALIQALAAVTPLHCGDLIITGTPAGVGFTRQPPRFLQPGEHCEVRIEGIGSLINPVVTA
ncbi:fumarylacetoacetate hydrolase family protein [Acidithiobacillus montserratensis]|uniref:Fumarylacetoacetate hydrolase family protein n=1 Tax=Acidithiobacillus montserratensis TaxID=2729135 RepID=A0ACD5HKM7_9PROT|nr:fumarylacetoacetate hydrolase family protein [Acidithiobacillus montserratensis]MBN2679576.1 fumarylacetoacetate hydrolase family protein [Acidithiobacillaceae bacterium]MBU2749317.1 fumarylacetoacetate hydrolase family protein [Acidithiobacillus montserratensis]